MRSSAAFSCALLPLLAACQPDAPNNGARLAVFDTAPPSPSPPVDTRKLIPMTSADVRRVAMTCLQSPPYPPDAGPMCLRPDGGWIVYSGWGNPQGSYTILGNEVRVGRGTVRNEQRLAFYRDVDGRIYMRDLDSPERRAFPFEPYAEADFLNAG